MRELDRRLASLIALAFDDCPTVYGRFKLLDGFDGLLDHGAVRVRAVSISVPPGYVCGERLTRPGHEHARASSLIRLNEHAL